MANTLTDLNKEVWAREMQLELEKSLVAMQICKKSPESLDGVDTINKPYRSRHLMQTYTPGTDFSAQDLTGTNEQLSINQYKVVPAYIDAVAKLQSGYDFMGEYGRDFVEDLKRGIDAAILSDYDQATSTVSDGDFGGTSGVRVAVTPSNVNKLFSLAGKKLNNLHVGQNNRFAVISPSVLENLQVYTGGVGSRLGDKVLDNGFVGSRFGFDIYVSANLTWTGRWTPANLPSDTQTITIAGVTFTFETGTPTNAGDIKSVTDVATTLDNVVASLNAPGTSVSGTFVAVTLANQVLLEGIVATDGTTYLGIEHVGGGELVVATSDTADPWSLELVHCVFGQKNATHCKNIFQKMG